METQSKTNNITSGRYTLEPFGASEIVTALKKTDEFRNSNNIN